MRLRHVSGLFFGVVGLVLVLNLALLLTIRSAQDQIEQALTRSEVAQAEVRELVQGTEQLASLVQSYTTTARTHYLDTYYEILGVWQGERAEPAASQRTEYWRNVIGGRRGIRAQPSAAPRSMIQRLRALDFTPQELQAAQDVLDATAELQVIEKIAFAATQGLFDRQTGQFVGDGMPDRAYAIELVHSPQYEALRADLAAAVARLSAEVERRTAGELEDARNGLNVAVLGALLANVLMVPMVLLSIVFMRRQVLRPIGHLVQSAAHFAAGHYGHRSAGAAGQVTELATLSHTLDQMAQAVEDELLRRDVAQREVAHARDQAEAAARAKAAFLANMSHEIRTPMNAIMGMTQLALRTGLPPLPRTYLDKAMAASAHLLQLVNDILDFSKIEAGGMTLEAAPFHVEELAARALALVRQEAQDKGLELLCDFEDATLLGHHAVLHGDALRLQQVLTNLLGNAVKFTEAGQVVLGLATEPLHDGGEDGVVLVLRVRDTGIGIEPEHQRHLFREFDQADASITRRYGGTGLGLAISQRLVTMMAGTIEVDSTPGAGSCFTVRVPLPVAASAGDDVSGDGAALHVLVVEDRPDTRATVMAMLQRLGIGARGRIVGAADGAQALAALTQAAERPFDLVLLDWVLPDTDGGRLLARLRQDWPLTRVLVMTAYGSPELSATAAACGAAVLDKPVMPQDLRRLVSDHAGAAAGTEPAAATALPLQGQRVLLVEDNALNREVVLGLLGPQGVQLQVAHHGLEAVERLQAAGPQAFDVVLMDLQMPVLDGYDAVRRLRQDRAFDDLPILAMTAHAMAGERQRCLDVGMQGYIVKPFVPEQLFAELARWGARAHHGQPVPAPPTRRDTAAALPVLAGLDSRRLLAHCDGNAALARRLLRGLARDYAEGLTAWQIWLDHGDWATLRREAHTLQGLAGTLAVDALRAPAQALEQAAAAHDEARARMLLSEVESRLASLLLALDTVREQIADAPAPPPVAQTLPAHEAAASGPVPEIAELALLLADSDSGAIDWWQRHQSTLAGRVNPVALRELSRAIDRFDFDAALAVCQRIDQGGGPRPPSTVHETLP